MGAKQKSESSANATDKDRAGNSVSWDFEGDCHWNCAYYLSGAMESCSMRYTGSLDGRRSATRSSECFCFRSGTCTCTDGVIPECEMRCDHTDLCGVVHGCRDDQFTCAFIGSAPRVC